jgi:energy-coupling factor transporter ATP-binding protein EcfA2
LEKLKQLTLDDNPLNPALKSAYEQGLPALRAYLRSLEEAEPLYEAKLVLVGEGGVGKTTLLKAMTGQEPREGEPTTHGVKINVQAMHLPHPEKQGVEIQFNSWDFGGQDVYRVTHQFFFSRRSIYLLVWEPRKGVQASQVEDWLKIIRLRVGDDARVIIVSTHCKTGERIARIDQPVLMRDFGSMIVGFHEVDSLVNDPATGDKVGIAELKTMIADAAKNLDQMGMPFNRDWRAARDELLAMKEPCIAYAKFADVCARHNLDDVSTKTLATLMHDLGYIVYYGDDERLKNDVVLQPEWLTKAIGFVLEDRKTQEMDGILPDDRLKEVWWDHPFKGEQKYEPMLYPFFLRLMEKYDVSYRLENGTASLVAQHVPQIRPALPWLADEEPTRGNRRIAMVCAMDDAPPGLVPWMIVRTHDYAYDSSGHRLHWQKGMFLRNTRHGEAMLELREREFHIYAQAIWPEFFMNVLRKTLQKRIFSINWGKTLVGNVSATICRGHVPNRPRM